jgi:hypothetical protein
LQPPGTIKTIFAIISTGGADVSVATAPFQLMLIQARSPIGNQQQTLT